MTYSWAPNKYECSARRAELACARRNAFIAGALAANPDLDAQQVQEMADEYIRHSEEER